MVAMVVQVVLVIPAVVEEALLVVAEVVVAMDLMVRPVQLVAINPGALAAKEEPFLVWLQALLEMEEVEGQRLMAGQVVLPVLVEAVQEILLKMVPLEITMQTAEEVVVQDCLAVVLLFMLLAAMVRPAQLH
jgi:hypothetical protein